mgnify:CR=1 FL=1
MSLFQNPRDMIPDGSPPNDRRLDCKFCGKIFKSHNYVKVHEAWHRGELKHKCTHCGRDFRFPSELKKHISIHTGEKPYKCERCGEGFNKVHSLNIHINDVHNGDGKVVIDDSKKIDNVCAMWTIFANEYDTKRRAVGWFLLRRRCFRTRRRPVTFGGALNLRLLIFSLPA